MAGLFHTYLYVPIFNLLIFLISVVPGGDVGLAVILATLAVKAVLLPFSLSAAHTQKAMKEIEPQIQELREMYKDDKEQQAREMFALYKTHDIKPFSSILSAFLQLPIIIALYWVVSHGLPHLETAPLYSFVHIPSALSGTFLGLFTVMGHSLTLAILAGLSQLAQAWYAIPVPPAQAEVGSPGTDMMRAMALQARFLLPFVIGFAAYKTSGAIALYFITSNIVALAQEFFVRQSRKRMPARVPAS